jgi:hypothetical protein|tara:strand:- start:930 stop:1055 length:126 start_codon:yes stop_codon:yes gene_type:complete
MIPKRYETHEQIQASENLVFIVAEEYSGVGILLVVVKTHIT